MSICSRPASNYGDGRGCQDENCPRHGGDQEPREQPWETVLSDGDGDLG